VSDIVERLRDYEPCSLRPYTLREAADELTALRARVKELEEENKAIMSDLPYVIGWNDGFEHALSETTNWQFPIMLRKMWSGTEVQKWIDERKAEARAALEAQP
jgi:hypothetical protein